MRMGSCGISSSVPMPSPVFMPLGWTWEIQGATGMLAQSQGLIKPQIPRDSTGGLSPVRPAEGRSLGPASFESSLQPIVCSDLAR